MKSLNKLFFFFLIFSGVPNENSKFDFDACMTLVKEKTLSFLTPKASLKNENEIYMPASFLSLLVKIGLIGKCKWKFQQLRNI